MVDYAPKSTTGLTRTGSSPPVISARPGSHCSAIASWPACPALLRVVGGQAIDDEIPAAFRACRGSGSHQYRPGGRRANTNTRRRDRALRSQRFIAFADDDPLVDRTGQAPLFQRSSRRSTSLPNSSRSSASRMKANRRTIIRMFSRDDGERQREVRDVAIHVGDGLRVDPKLRCS